jgi:hypothetical protein
MEHDRELELEQQYGRKADRAEDVDAPGQRANTDGLRPAHYANDGDALYTRASPLASAASSSDGGGDAGEMPVLTQHEAYEPEPAVAPRTAANANAQQDPTPAQVAAAEREQREKARPANAAASSSSAAASSSAPEASADAPASSSQPRAADKQGGRGGRSGSGSGSGSRAGGRGAAAVTHEVAQPAPSDPATTRTTLGVGEEVNFTAPHPGNWRATSSTGTPSATGVTTFRWKAPDTATNPTVTYSRDGEADIDTNFSVVAPTTVDFRKTQDDPQLPAGVGMWTNLTFAPQTVNFYNAEWLEEPGGPSNVSGYFAQYIAEGQGTLAHEPNTQWTSMQGATNNGVDDHAFIAGKPRLRMFGLIGPLRWYEGSFEWSIPNKYRVAGTSGSHDITTVVQRFEMQGGANAGGMTVTKGAASATQRPTGEMVDTTTELTERFETVSAARDYLNTFDSPVTAIKRGLGRLANLRAVDRTSHDNLVSALRAYSPAPVLVTSVRCTNTYSWVTEDSVSLTVAGFSQSFTLNTDRHRTFRIPWLTIIDPGSFNSGMVLSYTIVAEGHTFQMSQPFPFNEFGTQSPCPGSDGRYTLTSFLGQAT